MRIDTADSFDHSLRALDPADVRRVEAFLGKLAEGPEVAGLRPEIVHDAHDRAIRSYKVTHDLRAIAHVGEGVTTLIYVARHDVAYEWIRNRCIECHPVTGAFIRTTPK